MAGLYTPAFPDGPKAPKFIESPGLLRAQINGVYAVCILFLIVCWIAVTLRLYVRARILARVNADDWWMSATLFAFTAFAATLIFISSKLSEHVLGFARGEVAYSNEIPSMVPVGICLYCATMMLYKVALGMLFIKNFSKNRVWRYALWANMLVPTPIGVLALVWTAYFPCQTQMFFFTGLPGCDSEHHDETWLVITAIWCIVNAISDLMYSILAIIVVHGLSLPKGEKLTVGILCGLGTLGGVASVVRFGILLTGLPEISLLGGSLHTAIWSVIEPGLGITAASLATLRPLVRRWKNPDWTVLGSKHTLAPKSTTRTSHTQPSQPSGGDGSGVEMTVEMELCQYNGGKGKLVPRDELALGTKDFEQCS